VRQVSAPTAILSSPLSERERRIRGLAGRRRRRILGSADQIIGVEAAVTARETVRAVLERLPDDCSLDDVQYHLYVAQAIARGVADADAGRAIASRLG
jgi:hypothetical protein